jgi:hypothetical protein
MYFMYGTYGVYRVGQNHTFSGIYGVHTVFLAGKSPYIRPYTVYMYDSGQAYIRVARVGLLIRFARFEKKSFSQEM